MNTAINHKSNRNDQLDKLEAALLSNFKTVDAPVTHRFTPGLYTREIFIPAGSMITSMVHKTKHQFMVLEGSLSIFDENNGEILIEAPFVGVTFPGTRRVALAHEDTRWITCHPTNITPIDETEKSIEDAVSLIESEIIEPHINKEMGGQIKNNILNKTLLNG